MSMSYLELLKLASPEAIVTLTALIVLAIGVATGYATVVAGVSAAKPLRGAVGTAGASTGICRLVAALGLIVAIGAVVMLPPNADLFRGMLVISPLNSLFGIICLVLASLQSYSHRARHRITTSILPSFCSRPSVCCFSLAAKNYS